MKNEFLDKLIENLEAMKREGERPSVGKVIAMVIHTAVDQKLTFEVKKDILTVLMSLDGITPDEADLIRQLEQQKESES